ncbi:hypothetical protein AHAS_Ahas15G0124400 [Arachis hypogaea]
MHLVAAIMPVVVSCRRCVRLNVQKILLPDVEAGLPSSALERVSISVPSPFLDLVSPSSLKSFHSLRHFQALVTRSRDLSVSPSSSLRDSSSSASGTALRTSSSHSFKALCWG